ncbi:dTMP kinase [bacterium 210820-DFI.6.37]|nr:dTMP kinase [bacterium 210820-DFI.6.37]
MRRGLFITIEGPDGSGKSTQIQEITEFFRKRGEPVIVTREPGGTPISEKIREIILDRNHREMDPVTETLLYAASRAQHVAEVIRPALEDGSHVVCDRFIDSSIAYQGYGRGLGDCVSIINAYAVRDCVPDLTFLMKLDPGIGKSRIKKEEQDRIEMENAEFHERVFQGYEELELQFPDRIVGIDAGREVEAIREEILQRIERLLQR